MAQSLSKMFCPLQAWNKSLLSHCDLPSIAVSPYYWCDMGVQTLLFEHSGLVVRPYFSLFLWLTLDSSAFLGIPSSRFLEDFIQPLYLHSVGAWKTLSPMTITLGYLTPKTL